MMNWRSLLTSGVALSALAYTAKFSEAGPMATTETIDYRNLSDMDWRKRLTASQYMVLRQHSTERPGSSPSTKKSAKARLPVQVAICRCSHQKQNSRVAPVGRASINPCPTRWKPKPTAPFL